MFVYFTLDAVYKVQEVFIYVTEGSDLVWGNMGLDGPFEIKDTRSPFSLSIISKLNLIIAQN